MNLWGKVGYWGIVVIFSGCENDNNTASIIEIPGRENQPLSIQYKEMAIPSELLLVDSLITAYNPRIGSGNRLMAGRYTDVEWGTTSASAYAQFAPDNPQVDIADNAVLLSGSLTLSFDYYRYGTAGVGEEDFSVHALTEEMSLAKRYTSRSTVAFDPTPIGATTYTLNTAYFEDRRTHNDAATGDADKIDSLVAPLAADFAAKLFEAARVQADSYIDPSAFVKTFPGIAVVPGDQSSNIVRFHMDQRSSRSNSKITLYYEETSTETGAAIRKELNYSFYQANNFPLVGFTGLTADRDGTAIANLTHPHVAFAPLKKRYYQSGSPVIPVLDFTDVLSFADSLPNIIFNSLELSIEVNEDAEHIPPDVLQLRLLDREDRFININDDFSDKNVPDYPGIINVDEQGWLIIGFQQSATTAGAPLQLLYDNTSRSYSGNFTGLFQALRDDEDANRVKRFAVVAQAPWIGFSVNQFAFTDESVKLKFYYTAPL